MEESSSLPSEVVPIGESIGPVGASGPGPDLVGAFGQTEPDAPADAAADNGNGNGNGKEVEHVVARRFSSGWNRLLDPHHVRDKDFTFPGWNGLPFRGSIPSLKETDPEYRQPQVSYEPHIWILNLSVKEDLEDYRSVYQLVTNGSAVISAEERQYDKELKNWRIFLRWALMFTHMPTEFRA